ncbi:recombinase family protein [Corynebacterium sp.]|uniref:recombinase family protein n=1 Tax=Corynebacterium sp. TaxID=1720 RepID=UPI0026486874|nr:recombinase family protein [Corynebacterium sp.]MDN6352834.1 recombinase family protein [Corynebacterium sp.]MDN6376744.1 recombinase family protein [Corynebacterium sp.]MDN6397232.1 recombinase family protein [Corynebacterium sp.]
MSKKTVPSQGLEPNGQIVGYARVSSPEQNLERQTSRLTDAGAQKLFTDTVSGSTRDRPGLDAALEYLRAGDTLLVASMDRLARSLVDLHTLVDELTTNGITVTFLQEGQSYSANPSPTGKLLLGMLGAVAEFERSIIRERQAEGIARAKARGVYKGRKPVPGEKIEQARKLISQGVPKARVARDLGISRSSLYKHLGEDHTANQ